jgi:uncharacterized protein (UPF0332 family)
MWLLNRLFEQGDQPTPRFAFQGTVNWMRSSAIFSGEHSFELRELREFYGPVLRRNQNDIADTLSFEYLTMSLHNASSIDAMADLNTPHDTVRAAIVAWYYSVYFAAKSMIAASSGADPQTHAKTASIWQSDLVERNQVLFPFDCFITNLVPRIVEERIVEMRNGNPHNLNAVGSEDASIDDGGEDFVWRDL